ncbi:hypothetical protein [Neptuniibacter sp. QD37_11]|uniref:hypothetical protein n=1 Tax=Neptuniibacter sp. QD37_11 TaxID=3398209 RepID=UPI0039F477CD
MLKVFEHFCSEISAFISLFVVVGSVAFLTGLIVEVKPLIYASIPFLLVSALWFLNNQKGKKEFSEAIASLGKEEVISVDNVLVINKQNGEIIYRNRGCSKPLKSHISKINEVKPHASSYDRGVTVTYTLWLGFEDSERLELSRNTLIEFLEVWDYFTLLKTKGLVNVD